VAEAQGQFRYPEEEEYPLLKAITRELVKIKLTEKT
jgi:hypothetical protein